MERTGSGDLFAPPQPEKCYENRNRQPVGQWAGLLLEICVIKEYMLNRMKEYSNLYRKYSCFYYMNIDVSHIANNESKIIFLALKLLYGEHQSVRSYDGLSLQLSLFHCRFPKFYL